VHKILLQFREKYCVKYLYSFFKSRKGGTPTANKYQILIFSPIFIKGYNNFIGYNKKIEGMHIFEDTSG
jgi:hypothetical protein